MSSQSYQAGFGAVPSTLQINGLSKEYQMKEEGQKKKKPGFIKRWLYKIADEALDYKKQSKAYNEVSVDRAIKLATLNPIHEDGPTLSRDKAIRFNVYVAQGGRIVEVTRYDKLKDRHVEGLYVITGDQDFGREIDKILTMEALK